ncbi:protein jag [Raineyella sp. W15-4]|uniref:Jag family protein n=1 Tax=Raineyella sp. W15-4 TaxID=3081651 RepID=UPI00295369C7|nr:R3H domain-containing nucleic acid-binding protein [Raineyella sp. W15-4]WOQ17060.1 R3H domain-containing nucleic acid-binding protein [Raineyella sp. W15-4]
MTDTDVSAETVDPSPETTGGPDLAEHAAERGEVPAETLAADDQGSAPADQEPDDVEDEDGDDLADDGPDGPLEVEGEVAADYLEELLDIADEDGDIDTFVESGRAHVSIITDSDVLIGRNGEVLEALQELSRLAVLVETGHRSRLMLDIGGHREHRRRELEELAADAIEEVKETGESVRLTPMNPFERKIVHDAVAAAGLFSESEGEEPNRRVVVMAAED